MPVSKLIENDALVLKWGKDGGMHSSPLKEQLLQGTDGRGNTMTGHDHGPHFPWNNAFSSYVSRFSEAEI